MNDSATASNKTFFMVFLALTIASLIGAIFMFSTERTIQAGPFMVIMFASLAVYVRSNKALKGFSYTLTIFASVTAAMFYPGLFDTWGGFRLTRLIVPLMQIIMFGMGTTLSIKEFAGVIKMPKGVLVGIVCQFTIMPLVGFSLAKMFGFPPEIAAGAILIGSSPSGLASNVMTYLARANLALSVSLTAVATMLAPIMTPLAMKLLAGTMVEIVFINMMIDIIYMVIIPIVAGLMFNHYAHSKFEWDTARKHLAILAGCVLLWLGIGVFGPSAESWVKVGRMFGVLGIVFASISIIGFLTFSLAKGNTKFLDQAMPLLSMASIAYIITIITASGRDNLLQIGVALVFAAMLHNCFGYIFGYWGSRMFGMDKRSARTIAIEVGLQNGGMASGLALQMGRASTMGLAAAVFGPWMNISGSMLATWWRSHPVDETIPARVAEVK